MNIVSYAMRTPYANLREAELVYLHATGWVEHDPENWSHEEHDRQNLTQGHAVNVQKQYDRNLASNNLSMGSMIRPLPCPFCPKEGCSHHR